MSLLLALLLAAEVTVDLRDYITQPDPGYRHLGRNWGTVEIGLSIDGFFDRGEWSQGVRLEKANAWKLQEGRIFGAHFVSLSPAGLLGVYRDLAGPHGPWRCFSNVGEPCYPRMAEHPLQGAPLVLTVPVLQAKDVPIDYHAPVPPIDPPGVWTGADVWILETTTCTPIWLQQRVWSRTRVFKVESFNFGSDLGLKTDILVLEHTIYTQPPDKVTTAPPARDQHPHRMERYWFVKGWGLARQGGRDKLKRKPDDPIEFDPGYREVWWNGRLPGDFHARPICTQPTLPWLMLGR